MTQRLGVSRQTINFIENDRYDPSLPLGIKIARLFGVREEDVFFLRNGGKGILSRRAPKTAALDE
jgi:DNA-binding XRE family transcriptional regulator